MSSGEEAEEEGEERKESTFAVTFASVATQGCEGARVVVQRLQTPALFPESESRM
jgi:hypothetical protein